MTAARRQLVVLGVLLVVMAVVYARAFWPQPRRGPALPEAPGPASSASAAAAAASEGVISLALPDAEPAALAAQRERAASLGWERDPFTGGAAGGSMSGFDLAGILWDAASPIAMINGEMVRAGDQVEGYKVLEITQSSVLLSDGGQTVTVTLAE
jgi:hypothetical protein